MIVHGSHTPVVTVVLEAIRYCQARAALVAAAVGNWMPPGSGESFDAAIEAERILVNVLDRFPKPLAGSIEAKGRRDV